MFNASSTLCGSPEDAKFANLKFLSYLTMPSLGTKGLVIPRCERVTRVVIVGVATADPIAATEDPIPHTDTDGDGKSPSTSVRSACCGSAVPRRLSVGDGDPRSWARAGLLEPSLLYGTDAPALADP